jgi:hypothetical protein
MRERARLLIVSALVGCVVGSLPAWSCWEKSGEPTQSVLGVFMFPGLLVSLIGSRGWLHDMSWAFAVVSNCVFYCCLVYVGLQLRRRARRQRI